MGALHGWGSVVLQSEDEEDELIFVQVGKLKAKDSDFIVNCNLPGSKVQQGEMPRDALHRMIIRKLPILRGSIRIVRAQRTIERQDSKTYGVQTCYIRTVYHAEVVDDF